MLTYRSIFQGRIGIYKLFREASCLCVGNLPNFAVIEKSLPHFIIVEQEDWIDCFARGFSSVV